MEKGTGVRAGSCGGGGEGESGDVEERARVRVGSVRWR